MTRCICKRNGVPYFWGMQYIGALSSLTGVFMVFLVSLGFFVLQAFAQTATPELYAEFEKELNSPQGVAVEVHGADSQNGLYAIAYRPKNFFDYVIISLQADYTSPTYKEVDDQLKTLRRHDFLQIKGNTNGFTGSQQNHILVKELTVLKKFTSSYDDGSSYTHSTNVAQAVQGKTSVIVKVHASLADGKILMVELGDANVPVVVSNTDLTKDLYRGDKIEIRFIVQQHPSSPVHLKLLKDADAVKMLDRIVDVHGQPQDRCGELVMFPQSPQVLFNVFALKSGIGDGYFRTFTLINFNDPQLFKALRDKMQAVWDANTATMTRGRNYFINPKVKICAKGTGNMQVATQANPQILIDKIEDLTLEVVP